MNRLVQLALAAAAASMCLGVVHTPVVHADKVKARELYDAGDKSYNLGKFREAIDFFERGYLEHPSPIFLFNIGQSYRKLDNCEKSVFFYKRYLSEAPDAPNRDEVLNHIDEGKKLCEERARVRDTTPDGTEQPVDTTTDTTTTPTTTTTTGDDDDDDDDDVASADDDDDDDDGTSTTLTKGSSTAGTTVVSTARLGPAFIGVGDVDVSTTRFSVNVGAAYPMDLGTVIIEPGVSFTATPMAGSDGVDGSPMLAAVVANLAVRYPLMKALSLKAELGAGMMWFSGLEAGNAYTMNGAPTSGALAMPNVRVGVGAEYEIGTSGLVVSALPATFSYSPAKEGMAESIDAITRFEVLVGVGYRL